MWTRDNFLMGGYGCSRDNAAKPAVESGPPDTVLLLGTGLALSTYSAAVVIGYFSQEKEDRSCQRG